MKMITAFQTLAFSFPDAATFTAALQTSIKQQVQEQDRRLSGGGTAPRRSSRDNLFRSHQVQALTPPTSGGSDGGSDFGALGVHPLPPASIPVQHSQSEYSPHITGSVPLPPSASMLRHNSLPQSFGSTTFTEHPQHQSSYSGSPSSTDQPIPMHHRSTSAISTSHHHFAHSNSPPQSFEAYFSEITNPNHHNPPHAYQSGSVSTILSPSLNERQVSQISGPENGTSNPYINFLNETAMLERSR
jgi:hypothetical protein